jgi:kinesin family protein 18/19
MQRQLVISYNPRSISNSKMFLARSGKTHTMVGTQEDPGLMVLSLRDIFSRIQRETESEFEVTCSYLEVYNEVIYDLLERSSGHLELREDPEQGITVAGLQRIEVTETFRFASVQKLSKLPSQRETLRLSVDMLVLP